MHFRIQGLSAAPFRPLYGLSDDALASRGARRVIADSKPGFPDRIALRDAEQGESLILLNYVHQPADTPYRASHAIFVCEGEERTFDGIDQVPEVLGLRSISLRAFDSRHDMVDAGLMEGHKLEGEIERLLARPDVAYLHAHYAARGCYAARIDRVS